MSGLKSRVLSKVRPQSSNKAGTLNVVTQCYAVFCDREREVSVKVVMRSAGKILTKLTIFSGEKVL
jgi:hypothetical protein